MLSPTGIANLLSVIRWLFGIPSSLQYMKSAYLYLAFPNIEVGLRDSLTRLLTVQFDIEFSSDSYGDSVVGVSFNPLYGPFPAIPKYGLNNEWTTSMSMKSFWNSPFSLDPADIGTVTLIGLKLYQFILSMTVLSIW